MDVVPPHSLQALNSNGLDRRSHRAVKQRLWRVLCLQAKIDRHGVTLTGPDPIEIGAQFKPLLVACFNDLEQVFKAHADA
jgi:hypothetical protein